MREALRADVARCVGADESLWRKALVCLETQGIWAVAVYRCGRWVYTRSAAVPPVALLPLKLGYHLAQKLVEGDQILAIPTLVRRLPPPVRKIIGDLSSTERVLVGLDLRARAR